MNFVLLKYHKGYSKHLKFARANKNKVRIKSIDYSTPDCNANIPEEYHGIDLYKRYANGFDESDKIRHILTGDLKVIQFCKLLFNVDGYEWYDYQDMLCDIFLELSIRGLYYEEWEDHSDTIKRKYGFTKLRRMLASTAARREGKTAFVCAWFACLCFTICRKSTDFQLSCISTMYNQSVQMVKDIAKFIQHIPYNKRSVKVVHKEGNIDFKHYDDDGNLVGTSHITGYQKGDVKKNGIFGHIFYCLLLLFISFI